jgi:hypothetical protein
LVDVVSDGVTDSLSRTTLGFLHHRAETCTSGISGSFVTSFNSSPPSADVTSTSDDPINEDTDTHTFHGVAETVDVSLIVRVGSHEFSEPSLRGPDLDCQSCQVGIVRVPDREVHSGTQGSTTPDASADIEGPSGSKVRHEERGDTPANLTSGGLVLSDKTLGIVGEHIEGGVPTTFSLLLLPRPVFITTDVAPAFFCLHDVTDKGPDSPIANVISSLGHTSGCIYSTTSDSPPCFREEPRGLPGFLLRLLIGTPENTLGGTSPIAIIECYGCGQFILLTTAAFQPLDSSVRDNEGFTLRGSPCAFIEICVCRPRPKVSVVSIQDIRVVPVSPETLTDLCGCKGVDSVLFVFH